MRNTQLKRQQCTKIIQWHNWKQNPSLFNKYLERWHDFQQTSVNALLVRKLGRLGQNFDQRRDFTFLNSCKCIQN